MNVTATIFGQIITFAVLVFFVRSVLWEPMTRMLEDRKARIADGLAAAERGLHEKDLAEKRAAKVIHDAKEQAADIIAHAQKRATEIVEEAKGDARSEGQRLLVAAQAEIEQQVHRAKEELRGQVVSIAVAGAEKVLAREIDETAHGDMLKELAAQI